MSIDRWIDKEDVTHIYNGILLSHKKKQNWVICSYMDGPRDYHTKWNKSGREKQISYNITYKWNLKKWYKWTYLQNRNRLTGIENKLMVTKGERGGRDKLGVWDLQIHTIIYKIGKQQDLLYSSGNYTQYLVITYNGKISKKEFIYI